MIISAIPLLYWILFSHFAVSSGYQLQLLGVNQTKVTEANIWQAGSQFKIPEPTPLYLKLDGQSYNKKFPDQQTTKTSLTRSDHKDNNTINEEPKKNLPDHMEYMKNWFSFAGQNNSETNITTHIGQQVSLPCQVGRSVDAQVSWIRRRDWSVLSSDIDVYTHDSRFNIIQDKKVNKWSLVIQNIRASDMGLYECQISSSIGLTSVFIQLDVMQPTAEIIGNRNYLINFGSEISFTCVVHNTKPHAVFWYHNNMILKSDGYIVIKTKSHKDILTDGKKFPQDLKILQKYSEASAISHLNISASNIPQSGNFTCAVENNVSDTVAIRIGEDDKTAAVHRINSAQKTICSTFNNLLFLIFTLSIRLLCCNIFVPYF